MNRKIRLLLGALCILLLPSPLAARLLNLLGHRVCATCRFGFSVVLVEHLAMQSGARIGHLNALKIRRLLMRQDAYIGRANFLHGPIDVVLARDAAIGNTNKVVRGPAGVVAVGRAELRLGQLAKITANHRVDCTRSVRIGAFSTLAGVGIQVWTHGYVHEMEGAGRYRIDGAVLIENNVYIGAACVISMGVRIAAGVIVGAGTTVARDLDEPGLYVSSAIRQLPRPAAPGGRGDLLAATDARLCERVYMKV
ncbi:acyltransferase [Janthinobacterium sp. CG3]|uniref:acyltransferase n=1 Tax=Janthinobacterium sp. CG3 TaxID=1075768 RepID=UPI00034AA4C3|nr:hypothetical protein [Janthinobacterium sp. CG3]